MTGTSDHDENEAEFVHELESDEAPSEAVYTVVAAVSDRPPLDLEPLAHVVDPDALDRLFDRPSSAASEPRTAFEYCGYRVVVTADAVRVRADEADEAGETEDAEE